MSILDRVMAAYNNKHKLTPEMDVRVRAQLSPFITCLLLGNQYDCGAAPTQTLADSDADGTSKIDL